LEQIVPSDAPTNSLLAGSALPTRRCRRVSGYQEFLEVIFEPGNDEFTHTVVGWWDVHAEEFNVMAVNDILSRMRWPVRHRP